MAERCAWCLKNTLMMQYHDLEWGVPLYDDARLFEFLVLEGFQAGLSWDIVLKKRESFKAAFDGFNYRIIAHYPSEKVEELMQNSGIIRNRAKILGTINNAQCYLKVQQEFGSFSHYIWQFVEHKPVVNYFKSMSELPAKTELSDKISADLKKRGFKFVGSTVVYAHLQATGVVNDHLVSCFRHAEILSSYSHTI